MTNFEKWKQGLTVEALRRDDFTIFDCLGCPAQEFCHIHAGYGTTCAELMRRWAEREAEE